MADLRQLAAKAALNKMFSGSHFDICTIRNLATLFNVVPDRAAMAILEPLHCVNYDKMDRELYHALPSLVQQALSGTPVFQFDVVAEHPNNLLLDVKPPRKGLIARILG